MKKLLLVVLLMLSSCAPMKFNELESGRIKDKFVVNYPVDKVYEAGLKYVGSMHVEPLFRKPLYDAWFLSPDGKSAWFKQSHSLIELKAVDDSKTEITRFHPKVFAGLIQGDKLIKFFYERFK